MHSAIFTVISLLDEAPTTPTDLKRLHREFTSPDVDELLESMGDRADYVQCSEDSGNWHLTDLEHCLEHHPFIDVQPGHVFHFSKDRSYIRTELLKRLAKAEQFLAAPPHDYGLLFDINRIINEDDSFYINVVDTMNNPMHFMALGEFLLADMNVDMTYMIAAVTDYHC